MYIYRINHCCSICNFAYRLNSPACSIILYGD